MFVALTGLGFSAAAGLNAFIPLASIALLSRFTGLLELSPGFSWIASGPVLVTLLCLLAVELVLDRIPGVDTVNDVFQTLIRPGAGSLAFAASASAEGFGTGQEWPGPIWVAYCLGLLTALTVHLCKTASRTAIGAATGGSGTALASSLKDGLALILCGSAVVFPLLIPPILVGMGFAVYRIVTIGRRRRQRLTERQRRWRAEREAAEREAGIKGWLARPTRRLMERAGRHPNGAGGGRPVRGGSEATKARRYRRTSS